MLLKLVAEGCFSAIAASFNMLLSPVPEPETYALLLVGLGLIGFTLRNKKA
ncbi:PEP-CTERM sorting domain-containing protein [Nitrosomonas sp.]|uniref:PEP-CTERM sorting domain-containing protein n=1 Tax=Nitrosomonas sp. TaxID=42353 RepID=UPI003522A662